MTSTLDQVVSPPAREVCDTLQRAGHEAYLVGGAVRDALMGRPVTEWDVATSARPEQVTSLFKRTVPTGIQHGTVTVLLGPTAIEVTTYRGEGAYTDGRRPDAVTFGVPLDEDLARRDFVINAMAYDPIAGKLVDPYGGQPDLTARLIRAVGDPVERFGEDGLRVMRAIRFVAVLDFALDPATEAAIPSALPSLRKVSQERIRTELLKLLAAARPSTGLAVAARSGILATILPEQPSPPLPAIDAAPPDPILRLAILLREAGTATAATVCRRLKLSNEERTRVTSAITHSAIDSTSWTDPDVRRFIARVTRDSLHDALALATTDVSALRVRVDQILAAGDPLTIADLAITGADIMRILSIPPGRTIGEILDKLLAHVLENPSLNTAATLETLVRKVGSG